MRSRLIRTIGTLLLTVWFWNGAGASIAAAYSPYETYYKDGFGQTVRTQMAYVPGDSIGRDIFVPDPKDPSKPVYTPLQKPQDLFIDDRDNLYVADTGNNRIVKFDSSGKLLRVFDVSDSPLSGPQGLFVTAAGDIYVADTGNQRIVRLDGEGRFVREYKRPQTDFLPDSFKFDPVKLVVDKRGFLYVAALGGYQGLLVLDPEGNFQSFFGANETPFSLADAIKRILYTREMYLRELAKLPGSITSVTLDREGFIYTVTKEASIGQVRKHNIAGLDMLASKGDFNPGGAKRFGERLKGGDQPQLSDLTVDRSGNITVIDSKQNVVSQYDANGNLLFFWGGSANEANQKLGIVKSPSAIASDSSDDLYILDSENNLVQKFRLSEFGALVHKANGLTQDGQYEESVGLWEQVLRLNAYYTPALVGLGKAAYKQGDYDRARQLFLEAGLPQGYSDSFWQLRLEWFQRHFSVLMNSALIAAAVFYLLRRWHRRRKGPKTARTRRWNLLVQLKHAFYILRHPVDGFSEIRYESKAGPAASLILLVLALGAYGYMKAGTGFVFHPTVVLGTNLAIVLLRFLAVWLGWIVANYLVSTIYRGEGRFRDVVYGSAYALFPLALVGVPLTAASHALTLSEGAIYHALQIAMYAWLALMLFWNVQGIQNYSVGETLVNMTLSAATMAVFVILLFIVYGLTSELFDFIYSIYQEVSIR